MSKSLRPRRGSSILLAESLRWPGAAYHIVDSHTFELASDLVLEDVVGTESIDSDVSAHRDELRSTQIVEGDVVVEELGHSNDIGIGWGDTSGSYLAGSEESLRQDKIVRTFRKNCLNSSLLMTLSIFKPEPRTVS